MGIKWRIADASYWFYDRFRHKSTFEAARQAGAAPDFSGFRGREYAALVTFRRDGTPVPTPVWFALLDDGRLVTRTDERTAKVGRLRRDPHARVFPCDMRGKPLGPAVEGTARILADPGDRERAEAAMDHHYGRPRRVYEKLMSDEAGMVYVEVTAGAPSPTAGTAG
jgi:PPOX class probable F420-dependent enzyme